jgi:hypothetical protein
MSTVLTSPFADVFTRRGRRRRQQLIVPSLVVAFEMVVLDELAHGPPKMPLAQRNQLVQTFGLDRQLHAFDSGSAEDVAELLGEEEDRDPGIR